MSLKDVTSGDKIAKALSARLIASSKDTPGIEVAFEFEEPSTGNVERMTRAFWLSEASKQFTMETLVNVLGCNGDDTTDVHGNFTHPEFLNYGKEVKLVVELQEKTKENGDKYMWPEIKFVNSLGGSSYKGVTVETAKSILASCGFKGAFLAAKAAGVGLKAPTPNGAAVDAKKLPW